MKLGIFDSGLGGLLIAKAVREALPGPDIAYVGDTLHLPYGSRSREAILMCTQNAMTYMFEELDCGLIVIACNTASAAALRCLQQDWLPGRYPGRNILGVVVPTLEAALDKGYRRLGLIGTNYIVHSNVFRDELVKLSPEIEIFQRATPLLVPLMENDGLEWAEAVLRRYLTPLMRENIECLLLGCTHYPFLKSRIAGILGKEIDILSQDDIIPGKLAGYLARHTEYADVLTQTGGTDFYVSDLTESYSQAARALYGRDIEVKRAVF